MDQEVICTKCRVIALEAGGISVKVFFSVRTPLHLRICKGNRNFIFQLAQEAVVELFLGQRVYVTNPTPGHGYTNVIICIYIYNKNTNYVMQTDNTSNSSEL